MFEAVFDPGTLCSSPRRGPNHPPQLMAAMFVPESSRVTDAAAAEESTDDANRSMRRVAPVVRRRFVRVLPHRAALLLVGPGAEGAGHPRRALQGRLAPGRHR